MARFWKNALLVVGSFAAGQSVQAQNIDYEKLQSKDKKETQEYVATIQKGIIEKSTPYFQIGPSLISFFDQRIERATHTHKKTNQVSYNDSLNLLQMTETHLWRKRDPDVFEHYDILEEIIGFDDDKSGVIGDDSSEIWSKSLSIYQFHHRNTEVDSEGRRLVDVGAEPVLIVGVRALYQGNKTVLLMEETRSRKKNTVMIDKDGHYIHANYAPCHEMPGEINGVADSKEAFARFIEQVKKDADFDKKGTFGKWFARQAAAYTTACTIDPHKPPQL